MHCGISCVCLFSFTNCSRTVLFDDRVWDQLQKSDVPPPKEDVGKWEAEFNQLMSAQRDDLDLDYGGPMQEAWENGLGDFDQEIFGSDSVKFDEEGIPVLGPYAFGRIYRSPFPAVVSPHLGFI